jgi:hypothetical protein
MGLPVLPAADQRVAHGCHKRQKQRQAQCDEIPADAHAPAQQTVHESAPICTPWRKAADQQGCPRRSGNPQQQEEIARAGRKIGTEDRPDGGGTHQEPGTPGNAKRQGKKEHKASGLTRGPSEFVSFWFPPAMAQFPTRQD